MSTQIRDSDINFVVKVHVVNQITPHTNSAVFRPINGLPVDQFNSVYGDAFISGFAEGGEFIAIISITAKDKSTVQSLKGTLEIGYAGISAIGGARLEKTEALVDSETNVSVSWCGGGPSIAAGAPSACS